MELTPSTPAIAYEFDDRAGDAPVVTFLHALGASHAIWRAQQTALAGTHRILLIDLRGHGASAAPDEAYSLQGMAKDVLRVWDELGITRSALVGISLGGFIAQHVAIEAPERIEKLVLADTSAAYPPEAAVSWAERIRTVSAQGTGATVAGTLERWFTPGYRAAHPEVMRQIGALIEATPRAGYVGACHAIAALDTRTALARITAPTLVLVGEFDPGTPPEMAAALAAGIPGARQVTIASAAHLSCVEQAAVFSQLLSDFLTPAP
ncbi:3-oxoadipate enol-lactonase [Niveibacterium sp. SC-1]|uniref:3-oxoadipate enol-lactonase n=1 Tax=Niveibacterium sp. SC-1 TaxID=3135646 RepID=UPI00311DBEF2